MAQVTGEKRTRKPIVMPVPPEGYFFRIGEQQHQQYAYDEYEWVYGISLNMNLRARWWRGKRAGWIDSRSCDARDAQEIARQAQNLLDRMNERTAKRAAKKAVAGDYPPRKVIE